MFLRGRENIMTIITEGEIYVLERCAVYCEVSGSVPLSYHYRVSNINIYIILKPYQISPAIEHSDIWYGFHMMYILIFDTL